MARVHYLQHVAFEGLGSIEPWLRQHGHHITHTKLYGHAALPDIESIDWLIVMGGPMGVGDDNAYPWLKNEKQFIQQCITADKTVLGICLGAQLIADVLGAKVTRNQEKEIGWFPIKATEQNQSTTIGKLFSDAPPVFHWHGDTFAIPPGAIHLCGSKACENQAYLYKEKVLGLQFHLETTIEGAAALCCECANELTPGAHVQSARKILESEHRFNRINHLMVEILGALEETL